MITMEKEPISGLRILLSGLFLSAIMPTIISAINLRRMGYSRWVAGFNLAGGVLAFALVAALSYLANFGFVNVYIFSAGITLFWTLYQAALIKRRGVDVTFLTALIFCVPAVLDVNLLLNW